MHPYTYLRSRGAPDVRNSTFCLVLCPTEAALDSLTFTGSPQLRDFQKDAAAQQQQKQLLRRNLTPAPSHPRPSTTAASPHVATPVGGPLAESYVPNREARKPSPAAVRNASTLTAAASSPNLGVTGSSILAGSQPTLLAGRKGSFWGLISYHHSPRPASTDAEPLPHRRASVGGEIGRGVGDPAPDNPAARYLAALASTRGEGDAGSRGLWGVEAAGQLGWGPPRGNSAASTQGAAATRKVNLKSPAPSAEKRATGQGTRGTQGTRGGSIASTVQTPPISEATGHSQATLNWDHQYSAHLSPPTLPPSLQRALGPP